MTERPAESEQPEQAGPIIRDKRRIDPETGAVREPAAAQHPDAQHPDAQHPVARSGRTSGPSSGHNAPLDGPGGEPAGADAGDLADGPAQLAERTADLQRVQAEYANYRRRVDRDRDVVRDTAVANVLGNLLPVLDDIGRAREHGELEGGFKSVGEALEQTVERLGLVRFGAAGDPFDPTVHEALTHRHSAEVTEPTCVEVFQPGYRIGDRVVRPARVAVADPE